MIDLSFGTAGNGTGCLLAGWSLLEGGFTWSVGAHSEILLCLPGEITTDMLLELEVSPFLAPPRLSSQALIIHVNGTRRAALQLHHATVVAVSIPASDMRDSRALHVRLEHPQATSPSDVTHSPDTRQLGFALARMRVLAARHAVLAPGVQAPPMDLGGPLGIAGLHRAVWLACGMTLAELALSFESLGHNCEFGLVQRHCGAEPLGLLRFAGISPANLVRGLETGFAGIGTPQNIEPVITPDDPNQEWMIREHQYGLMYHTCIYAHAAPDDLDVLLRKNLQKLQFEQRKFLEDLHDPRKIFVYQAGSGMAAHEALAVWHRLRGYGDAALLFVTSGAGPHSGAVVQLADGLYQGFIDRLAPVDQIHNIHVPDWISIMANTHRLRAAS